MGDEILLQGIFGFYRIACFTSSGTLLKYGIFDKRMKCPLYVDITEQNAILLAKPFICNIIFYKVIELFLENVLG